MAEYLLGKVKGDEGKQGKQGEKGIGIKRVEFIPSSVSGGENRLKFIFDDDSESEEFIIYNGKDGQNGIDGQNGRDGINGKDGLDEIEIRALVETIIEEKALFPRNDELITVANLWSAYKVHSELQALKREIEALKGGE